MSLQALYGRATGAVKGVAGMAFMMWMSGSQIHLFSIMMTFQGIYQPIAAIVGSGEGQQSLQSCITIYQKPYLPRQGLAQRSYWFLLSFLWLQMCFCHSETLTCSAFIMTALPTCATITIQEGVLIVEDHEEVCNLAFMRPARLILEISVKCCSWRKISMPSMKWWWHCRV